MREMRTMIKNDFLFVTYYNNYFNLIKQKCAFELKKYTLIIV